MTHSFFSKLTIGECKESFKSFRTLLSLSKKKFACNRYFSSMSTENDNSSSFFRNVGFKVYIRG